MTVTISISDSVSSLDVSSDGSNLGLPGVLGRSSGPHPFVITSLVETKVCGRTSRDPTTFDIVVICHRTFSKDPVDTICNRPRNSSVGILISETVLVTKTDVPGRRATEPVVWSWYDFDPRRVLT